MKIAIPLDQSHHFSPHYGASAAFACCEVDPLSGRAGPLGLLLPSGGSPCSWPAWLRAEGVSVLLVGGMGAGARASCAELGIELVPGVPPAPPERLAADYAAGRIQPGENRCGDGHDHDHHHGDGHHHGHGQGCCQNHA